jgi:hypothetical protein
MSARRIRFTLNNKYTQPLKIRMANKIVLTLGADYNSILFTKRHKGYDLQNPNIVLTAKFNSTAFEGVNILAFMENADGYIYSIGSCVFKIYSVNPQTNWVPILLYTATATQNQKRWLTTLTQANIGSTELNGDNSFLIEATLAKWGRTFKKRVYLNHLGIFDNLTRLKQQSDLLLISKLDD